MVHTHVDGWYCVKPLKKITLYILCLNWIDCTSSTYVYKKTIIETEIYYYNRYRTVEEKNVVRQKIPPKKKIRKIIIKKMISSSLWLAIVAPLMFHISKEIVVKVLEWRPPEGIWLSFKVSSGMSLFIKISSTPFLSNFWSHQKVTRWNIIFSKK